MEILNQFGINPLLLAAQVVNFLILLLILKKFAYKPILKVLDKRKQKIADSLKNAEEIERKLVQIQELEEDSRQKAINKSEEIINQAREDTVRILEDARSKYEEILENASEQAKKISQIEKIKIQDEIRQDLAGLVAVALQKLTGKALTKKDQKQLIEKAVKEIEV